MLPHLSQLNELCRGLDDVLRADQRLNLQIQSILRRMIPGTDDKAKKATVAKVMKTLDKTGQHSSPSVCALHVSRQALLAQIKAYREAVEHLTETFEVASFVTETKGLGLVSLGRIIGACQSQLEIGVELPNGTKTSAPHGNVLLCANPAKVWKRMGVGVMPDGTRQRRIAGADAIDHGYNPSRRSMLYVIGVNLIKAKDPYYSKLYAERKKWKTDKEKKNPAWCRKKKDGTPALGKPNKMKLHLDALRYVQKRLLLKLWHRVEQVGLGVITKDATVVPTKPDCRTSRHTKKKAA